MIELSVTDVSGRSSMPAEADGPIIRVFEPALCCNTGVCGPDVDENLVTFTADLAHLRDLGVNIARHNLANDPGSFTAHPAVTDFLRVAGSGGLPLVLVDGVTVAAGRYPDRTELLRLAGRSEAVPTTSACCAPSSDGGSGCC